VVSFSNLGPSKQMSEWYTGHFLSIIPTCTGTKIISVVDIASIKSEQTIPLTITSFYLFTYVFMCCLFNDAVSSSDYIASNNKMINEK
jgi:hypothetical protein